MYQPKTGAKCSCRPGIQRDNCPACEGTGQRIDFAAVRARKLEAAKPTTWALSKDAVPVGFTQITIYEEESGKRIATVFDSEAARQIVAIPKMLAALREMLEACPRPAPLAARRPRYLAAVDAARAAIAEAEGRD